MLEILFGLCLLVLFIVGPDKCIEGICNIVYVICRTIELQKARRAK